MRPHQPEPEHEFRKRRPLAFKQLADVAVRYPVATRNGDWRQGVVGQVPRGLGVEAVAPERRSTAYLARYLKDDIAKWTAPIKASGATVE